MSWPTIDIWRMSASRPWQLEQTHDNLVRFTSSYKGERKFHLIESILVREYSEKCIEFGKNNGYEIHIIDPAKGQGFAVDYTLKNVLKEEFSLKMEDDFMPEVQLPLNDCVLLMQQYSHINQICFNKRSTLASKRFDNWSEEKQCLVAAEWPKEQRWFEIRDNNEIRNIPLVVKEKWWFGSAVWRNNWIKPIFKYWEGNTHNYFNEIVALPLAGFIQGDRDTGRNKIIPTPKQVEENIGCYIYGKTGDPRMCEHTGVGDSIWAGEYQKKIKAQGKELIGI